MKRLITLFLCASTLFLNACQVGTNVYKDGFRAIQVTKLPAKWNEAGKEFITYCRWDQLMGEKDAKGNIKRDEEGREIYYCPPDGTKEGYSSSYEGVIASSSVSGVVVPAAIHGLAFLGGTLGGAAIISSGLRHIPASSVTQSSTTSQKSVFID
jgi:hypothetical protein